MFYHLNKNLSKTCSNYTNKQWSDNVFNIPL